MNQFVGLCLATFLVVCGGSAHAQLLMESKRAATCSVTFENDLFGPSDRDYTNGVMLSCLSRDVGEYAEVNRFAAWLDGLLGEVPYFRRAPADESRKLLNVGVSVGQKIYTPTDLRRSDLIQDERPYAGWLYFGTALHSRNERQMDTAELQLGIVGPWALGREAQNGAHGLFGVAQANGWDNQLRSEPGIMLVLEHREKTPRLSLGGHLAMDAIGHAGVALGNVLTAASAGAELRAGWRIPRDFGTSLIRPGGDVGGPVSPGERRPADRLALYGFTAVSGRYVLRDIFLDGNSFRSSHSVDKKPKVADFILGFGVAYKRFKLTLSRVYRTREFNGQAKAHSFGSVNLAVNF